MKKRNIHSMPRNFTSQNSHLKHILICIYLNINVLEGIRIRETLICSFCKDPVFFFFFFLHVQIMYFRYKNLHIIICKTHFNINTTGRLFAVHLVSFIYACTYGYVTLPHSTITIIIIIFYR